jgi:transcriptional regulator with XRE-family HTH domain
MSFGQKRETLRGDRGMSQKDLAGRLCYQTNSHVSDVEKGKFIPSRGKLKKIAKAMGILFTKLNGFLIESRLEQMGIEDPGFVSMLKDYPWLTKGDKTAITEAYLRTKNENRKSRG